MTNRRSAVILAGSIAVITTELVVYIHYGNVFLDAGFYLSAAHQVLAGKMPYRDFFFVQPPVFPYVYSVVFAASGTSLAAARTVSALFGLGTVLLLAAAARHSAGLPAAALLTWLLACSPFQLYHFSVTKLYGLTAFWLALTFFLLGRGTFASTAAAGCCAALATSTRLTVLPVIPAYLLLVVLMPLSKRRRALLAAIPVLVTAAVFLPFLITAPAQLYYNLFAIHVSATGGPHHHSLVIKCKVLLKIAYYFALPSALLGVLFLRRLFGWKRVEWTLPGLFRRYTRSGEVRLRMSLWLTVVGITVVHVVANWFSADYQAVVMPLFCLTIAIQTVEGGVHRRRWFGLILCLLGIGCLAGQADDFIWFHEGRGPLANIQDAASFVQSRTAPESPLITANAFYAFAAGRPVLPGFEGAPFTFTPGWDEATCRRFHCYNAEMLTTMIDTRQAGSLVLYADSFAVGFPGFYSVDNALQEAIWEHIGSHYREAARFVNFRGYDRDLVVYLPRIETRLR
ncbi:glycosyltransferase family 39 protein [bacterium]|nr:glycosyltransferase family 39 protein [candidate division CSSED10-310 bacterium]